MDDLHDARHGPLFMLYLKKLDWTADRKVQVRHGRHGMEGLRLNTCFCQLCHGNHEWMKGLAEALKINTAFIFKAPAKRFIEPWFQWQIWFGLTSFQNTFSITSLRKAQHWLNPPKVCKSNLHTALSHSTASWHFSALHYQLQMASIIRENICVLDNFSAWSSINRINGQKCHQKKWHGWHGWPAWCTAWSLVHAVPQEARPDCRSESPGSSWSPWHGRSTTEHMFLPALSWKPRVNERSGRGIEDQHGVHLQGPSQTFHRAMVSMTNLVWADFLSEHLQYHVTPQGSTLAQPSKGLQKQPAHCTVALHCLLAFQCASLSASNGPHHTWKRLRLGQFLCVK